MDRRRYVAGLATAGVALSAGCIGGLLDDVTTYEADPATVTDGAADDAGYEHQETREETEEEEFAGQTVEVTNHVSEYNKSLSIEGFGSQDLGVFATIATPQVEVAGESFNPVDDMDNEEIVDHVQNQYSGLTIGESVGTRDVDTLGTTAEVETFEGTAEAAGQDVDVLVDVSQIEHGSDFVIVVGVYPELLPDESENVTTMIEGLEHED